MSDLTLMCIYGASALVAMGVFVAILRARRLTSLRSGVLVYLSGTLWWAIVDVLKTAGGPSWAPAAEAWTMLALALVLAGLRLGVYGATHAGQKIPALNALGFAVHPAVAVMVASQPALWHLVATEGVDGAVTYGPLFWVNVTATYTLFIAVTIDFFRNGLGSQVANRKMAPVVAFIWFMPIVASIFTIVFLGPGGIDLMPPTFALTALAIWRALLPFDMRLAVRVARSQVLEELADAIIVLGNDERILDANAAALKLVGAQGPASEYLGAPLRKTWPEIADVAKRLGEHDLRVQGLDLVLDVTISPLSEASGAPSGRALVLRDVTQAVIQRRELARLRSELADLAVRDAATGLHNRRFVEQTLPDVLARCVSKGVPMSIAMIDVDHFKKVNDTHGHPVGDRVLREVAEAMLKEVPASMIARIGGEEFLAMLPGLTSEQAIVHTEVLRKACAQSSVLTREGPLEITVSAGVATTRDGNLSVEELMEAADAALYRAKREGRDRTCVIADVTAGE